MPYHPNLPADDSLMEAREMRSQFNGLKTLIDNVPAGPPGPIGPPGPPVSAVVDATNTLDPGQPANAQSSFDGVDLHFTFGIPRGENGSDGAPGAPGLPAQMTATCAQSHTIGLGAAWFQFADAPANLGWTTGMRLRISAIGDPPKWMEGTIIGLDAGEVQVGVDTINGSGTFNGWNLGLAGQPGEVSAAQLDAAIAGTSSNSNSVATLNTPFADPDLEALRQKTNELILALRR